MASEHEHPPYRVFAVFACSSPEVRKLRRAADQGAFDVCYALNSGAKADIAEGPSRATSRLVHRSKLRLIRSPR
jgi:hypothetical protein